MSNSDGTTTAAKAAQAKTQIKTQIKTELASSGPVHVVYLDDDPILLETYKLNLTNLGFIVCATTSVAEAEAYISTNLSRLAMIVSDFQMPAMNGFAFRQRVALIAPKIPFVILSGYVDTQMALRGLELKIAGFVDKTNSDHLMEVIAKNALVRVADIRDDDELLKGFITESEDLVERAEDLIMNLDQNPRDMDTINHFFGLVHTLKGASSFFEPKTMHHFAHRFEDVLKKLQRGDMAADENVISQLLAALDLVKGFVADFKSGSHRQVDAEAAFNEIFSKASTVVVKGGDTEAEGDPKAKSARAGNQPAEIRVPVTMLDEFMHISGEMTVIRNMLNKCVRSIEKQYSGDKEIAMLVELLEELHKVNVGVQSKISEMRKIPVRAVLKPIPRAVREVSMGLGKDVQLTVIGDELRIDTAIADVLTNSLLHIVKNSIDHGLEMPDDREALGKKRSGAIEITSRLMNEQVIVEIKDDGRGLNVVAIREKLVRNGSHTQAEAEALPMDSVYSMIFEPGFSTAQKVTDISGRGVGMSLVKSVVESIRGKITIQSKPGQGSKFTLTLPVPRSVLITNCLFVRAGQDQFGILEEDVLRVLQLSNDDERIRRFEGGAVLFLEGELIPLAELNDILNHSNGEASTLFVQEVERMTLVIVQSSTTGQKLGLRVQEILDVEDTVIKAMPFQINPQKLYQGATFLDDGTVGLILYSNGIIEKVGLHSQVAEVSDSSLPGDGKVEKDTLTERVLLFESNTLGLGALLADEINRIEEFEWKSIQIAMQAMKARPGPQLIPYRGRSLTLKSLDDLLIASEIIRVPRSATLSGSPAGVFPIEPLPIEQVPAFDERFQFIVTEREGRLFGIPVARVLEISELEVAKSEVSESGILCRGFRDKRVVTVYDVAGLLNHYFDSKRAERSGGLSVKNPTAAA